MTQKIPNEFIDAVYVLSVKKFTDRISHILSEMDKHQIKFEFIFDYDVGEIDKNYERKIFGPHPNMGQAQRSLILKHVLAWKKCVEKNHKSILVFEDDVILNQRFNAYIYEIMMALKNKPEGYLVFLGGADTRVPKSYFLTNEPIFENPIATADGYITDQSACKKRIDWLSEHIVKLPADHLLKHIDKDKENVQYWSSTPLVEQGSVFGMFTSTLDKKRIGKSKVYNLARYRLKILTRRIIPRIYYTLAKHLGLFK